MKQSISALAFVAGLAGLVMASMAQAQERSAPRFSDQDSLLQPVPRKDGDPQSNPLEPSPQPKPQLTRPAPPSILAILAHPDDEITFAPVLSAIARDGGEVTLVFATSGDVGPGLSGLEPGERLARRREREGRCAAFALGLEEPVFWQLGDGKLGTMARAPDSPAMRTLTLVEAAITEAKPDVIVTWGPDGGYGHADHRMISALVTQVMARKGPGRPDLLYAAFPQDAEGVLPGFEGWATTDPSLITDRIRYDPADLEATQTALQCYESQFPPAVRDQLVGLLHSQVWRGTIQFRSAFPADE
ncbi:MAG: PIG-L family deacetylase [Pseudomonadota bacterium]